MAMSDGLRLSPSPINREAIARAIRPMSQGDRINAVAKNSTAKKLQQLQDLLDPSIVKRGIVAPWGRDKQGAGQWAVPGIVAGAMKALDQTGEAMRLPPNTSPDHPAYKGVFDVAGAINMPALLRKGATSTLGMNLWHGGPNKWAAEPGFPQGRPRLDKMGEGEGNAAFGEGFYSAQNPYVAKDYQRRLSPKPAQITYDGKPVSASSNRSSATRRGTDVTIQEGMANELYDLAKMQDLDPSVQKNLVDILQREKNKVATQKYDALVRAEAEGMSDSRRIPLVQQYDDHLAMLNSIDPKLIRKAGPDDVVKQGQLYKIDVPDEDIAKYLDWDKPLVEQSDKIKKVIENLRVKINSGPGGEQKANKYGLDKLYSDTGGLKPALTGEDFYRQLRHTLRSPEAVSKALAEAGIPGLRYSDRMSRGKDKKVTYMGQDITSDGYASQNIAADLLIKHDGNFKKAIGDISKKILGLRGKMSQEVVHPREEAKKLLENLADEPGAIDIVDARTRNYVTWDQKVLDRTKVLQRNEEIYKQLEKSGVPFT
jgi:hypothetical protein